MYTKYYSSFVLLLFILISCCKEPIIEESELDPIVGQWEVFYALKGNYPNVPNSEFVFEDSTELAGYMLFNSDGTGALSGSIEQITCYGNDFLWVKDDSLGRVYFILGESLFTYGIIQNLSSDSLLLDLRDKCINSPYIGGFYAYQISLIKQ